MTSLAPGLARLRHYQRDWLRPDVLAGVTVAAYLVPQCMAYGELAGLQPVAGLWAILAPLAVYALFGSSRQLSVGPESTTAVMAATALAPLAAGEPAAYAALAAALAAITGLWCLIGRIARLGFLANLLSKPVLVGYMAGVAVTMITGQLTKTTGVPTSGDTPAAEIHSFFTHLADFQVDTFVLATAVVTFLFIMQKWFPKLPGPLIAVLASTTVVAVLDLDQHGISVVGAVPQGLPLPGLPDVSWSQVVGLLAPAVGIAVVGYTDNVLTARSFANKNGYRIDANQELLSLGLSNIGAGLFQGFPVSSSGSRTSIGDSLGSRSQLYSLVALGCVVLVLLFLGPLLALFPSAALGAIVVYAAIRLIDLPEFRRMLAFRRSEFGLAAVALVGVLVTNILVGVLVAVGLSIVVLFSGLMRPHDAVLGRVPGLPGLHDVEDWPDAQSLPGLCIYRYDAPLMFANAEDFRRRALQAIEDYPTEVEWFVLNVEAWVDIDITAVDTLHDLIDDVTEHDVVFAMARVKQDLYDDLELGGLVDRIGEDRLYPTLPTAIDAFERRGEAVSD
ncbi:MAG: sulfate permease [Acidimicrobiales bacterium]